MGFNWSLIEQELFNPRFGGMSATELRKVLFAVYLSGVDEKMVTDDYRLGRMLGLTARQVANLKVGANLLLETEEKTEMIAKEYFKNSLEAGHMEYQPSKKRIAIQVEDPIAFNYLSSMLSSGGVFRKCDAANGHIAVPVAMFQNLLQHVFPEYDSAAFEKRFSELYPEFLNETKEDGASFDSKFDKWLSRAVDASAIVSNLVPCIQLGLKAFGVVA